MRLVAEREAELMARRAGPPASQPSARQVAPSNPGAVAAPAPAPQPAPAPAPTPARPAVPAPPAPQPSASPIDEPESQDLVQLLDRQRKKDTMMYVLAALLFAIGIGVWLMNQ